MTTVGRTCGRCGAWQIDRGACRECERRRVLAYVDRKKDELGEHVWRERQADAQRARRQATGDPYGRARRQAVRELVASHPDEYTQLRAAAVAAGQRQPGAVARLALARRYAAAVSERTRQLRRRTDDRLSRRPSSST